MTMNLREGVRWINEYFELDDRHHHVFMSLFESGWDSIIVDIGSFYHRNGVRSQVQETTDSVDAVILSHADSPHSGNVREFKKKGDEMDAIAAAGTPELQGLPTDVYRKGTVEEEMDVGERTFSCIDPSLADRGHTTWRYDHDSEVQVTADGFGHYHTDGTCDLLSSEFDDGTPKYSIHQYHRGALRWLPLADPAKLRTALANLSEEYDPNYVAPIHVPSEEIETYVKQLTDVVEDISRP